MSTYARSGEAAEDGVLDDMDAKKIIGLVVIVFLGFWMFTDPSGLAASSKDAGGAVWSAASDLFAGLIDFINEL